MQMLLIHKLFFSISRVVHAGGEPLLEAALGLYMKKDFLGSVKILEGIENKNDRGIYLIWKNEKEIGRLADPSSRDPINPNNKFYKYVKPHPEYSSYYEQSGSFSPTEKRYQEITQLFPESEYGGVIFYDLIEEEYLSFSEDGLSNSGRLELISQYQGFVNKYSKHPNAVKAENNIEWFEEDLMEF